LNYARLTKVEDFQMKMQERISALHLDY